MYSRSKVILVACRPLPGPRSSSTFYHCWSNVNAWKWWTSTSKPNPRPMLEVHQSASECLLERCGICGWSFAKKNFTINPAALISQTSLARIWFQEWPLASSGWNKRKTGLNARSDEKGPYSSKSRTRKTAYSDMVSCPCPEKKNAGSRIARHTTSPTRFPISCSLSSETDWSCRTENHWPSDSPDLSCLDFSFWQRAADDFVRLKP